MKRKLNLPNKAREIDISDCKEFDIINQPIESLVLTNPKEFDKYQKWIKLNKCGVKIDNIPKIPYTKETEPHLEEARVLCNIKDLALKDNDDTTNKKEFYIENFSLTYMDHLGSDKCHVFTNFVGKQKESEKNHYEPSTLRIVLPKKIKKSDKNNSNLKKIKGISTLEYQSKTKSK